jgi:hypothetical protein
VHTITRAMSVMSSITRSIDLFAQMIWMLLCMLLGPAAQHMMLLMMMMAMMMTDDGLRLSS